MCVCVKEKYSREGGPHSGGVKKGSSWVWLSKTGGSHCELSALENEKAWSSFQD